MLRSRGLPQGVRVVQETCEGNGTVSQATVAAAVANVPAVGNLLFAMGAVKTAQASMTFSDDAGGVWTTLANNVGAVTASAMAVGVCKVAADYTGKTITLTFPNVDTRRILWVVELAGAAPIAEIVLSHAATFIRDATADATRLYPSVNPTDVGDLLVAWSQSNGTEGSYTAPSSPQFTNFPAATSGLINVGANSAAMGGYMVAVDRTGFAPSGTGTAAVASEGCTMVIQAARGQRVGQGVVQSAVQSAVRATMVRREWRRTRSGILVPELGWA